MPLFAPESPFEALDYLSDAERKKFLEQFSPGAIHTGPMARSAADFTPMAPAVRERALSPDRPPLTPDADVVTPPVRLASGDDDGDLMRRFMEAQQTGAGNAAFNRLGSRMDSFARTYAGVGGPGAIQEDASLRGRPVADLMQAEGVANAEKARTRQQEVDSVNLAKTKAETRRAEASAEATEQEAAREAALATVDSTETQAVRKTAGELLKGRVSPETLATMTGAQIRDTALKFGVSLTNAEAMAGYRSGQQEIAERRLGLEEEMRRAGLSLDQYRAMLAKQGLDLDAERVKNEAARIEADRQRSETPKGTVVPGYEFAPGAAPSPDDAKKVKASLASADRLQGDMAELRDLYQKHGTKLTGPVATRMRQLARSIELEAKTVAELGALTGPDLSLVRSLASSDPGSFEANVKSIVGLDETVAGLDGLEKWTKRAVASSLKVYGYVPATSGAPDIDLSRPPPGQKSSLAPPRVSPSGQRILSPPSNLPPMEKDPSKQTKVHGSGTEDDPYIITFRGKPDGYIRNFVSEGEVVYVRDLDGGRILQKVNGTMVYRDGKPPPRFAKKKASE